MRARLNEDDENTLGHYEIAVSIDRQDDIDALKVHIAYLYCSAKWKLISLCI